MKWAVDGSETVKNPTRFKTSDLYEQQPLKKRLPPAGAVTLSGQLLLCAGVLQKEKFLKPIYELDDGIGGKAQIKLFVETFGNLFIG